MGEGGSSHDEASQHISIIVKADFLLIKKKKKCVHFINNSLWEIRAASQQPQEQRHPVLRVHAGSCRVSVIHRTLTMPETLYLDMFYVFKMLLSMSKAYLCSLLGLCKV